MRIVVAGGGIAGLSVAIAFGRRNIPVTLFERESALNPVGAGIVIHPNGMSALHELGLAEAVAAHGTVLRSIVIHRDAKPIRLSLQDIWTGARQPSIALTRSSLQHVLLSALSGQHIELSRTVSGFSSAERKVRVGGLAVREVECDLFVAADGVRSNTRRQLGLPVFRELGLTYLRFCTSADVVPPDEWHTYGGFEFDGVGVSVGFIPLGGGLTHVFLQFSGKPVCLDASGDVTNWAMDRLDRLVPELSAALGGRTDTGHYGMACESSGHRWQEGRVAFVGDAAHALAPTFSEGASLAIEDAIALAEVVADCGSSDAIDAALRAYERVRSARVAWADKMAKQQVRALLRSAPNAKVRMESSPSHMLKFLQCMYQPLLSRSPVTYHQGMHST